MTKFIVDLLSKLQLTSKWTVHQNEMQIIEKIEIMLNENDKLKTTKDALEAELKKHIDGFGSQE